MYPSEMTIWLSELADKTLSRKLGECLMGPTPITSGYAIYLFCKKLTKIPLSQFTISVSDNLTILGILLNYIFLPDTAPYVNSKSNIFYIPDSGL